MATINYRLMKQANEEKVVPPVKAQLEDAALDPNRCPSSLELEASLVEQKIGELEHGGAAHDSAARDSTVASKSATARG